MQGVRVLPPGASEQLAAAALRKTPPSALPAHLGGLKGAVQPQPTYVNMHELASMAADKAQQAQNQQTQQSFPPPPAEFISPPEKPEGTEKESSTSESSLESSSGYGSQTTFNIDDHNQHIDDITISNANNAASKYCTLPRNHESLDAQRRRPLSMTAMNTLGTLRNNLLRRGSMQTNKPPPPIRRTSSITNTAAFTGSFENLPPPPAFLLEPSSGHAQNEQQQQQSGQAQGKTKDVPNTGVKVAETVKALTELKHTPASPNSIRRMAGLSGSAQNIFQPQQPPNERPSSFQGSGNIGGTPAPVLSTFQTQSKVSYLSQSGGVVYAQPSQVMGGSPNAVRRITSFRSQSADRKSDGPGKVGSNFLASLNAKLATNSSPKSSRRNLDDHAHTQVTKVQQPQRGPGQSFLDSLNAKLAQQHLGGNVVQPVGMKANKIRQIINSKAQPDPKVCHESLMDQIKRGATLKRSKIVNDRSAPKIY